VWKLVARKGVRTFVRPEVQRGPAKSGNAQLNIPQRADTEPVRSPVHGRINQYTAGVKEKNGKRKREREKKKQKRSWIEISLGERGDGASTNSRRGHMRLDRKRPSRP